MLGRIIHGSLRRPWLVVLSCLTLFVVGLWWVRDLPAEIFPALTPAQTVVQTEAPGLVAEQVEQLVTRPIENALGGIPGVSAIRSDSVQGLSVITLDFARTARPEPIRQAVVQRLAEAAALPPGVAAPRIAPLTAATGQVLKIGFTSARLDPMALRNIVQWTVRPRLLATSGVANVALYGGQTRRVEVRARPGDLSDSDLGFDDVLQAVRRATSVAGAGFLDTPQQRVVIDSHGQALRAEDVAAGQIQTPGNAPVRIGDVADVVDAPAPATGDALIMGKPGVLAEVSAVYGADTLDTTHAVERALDILRPALAAQGVTVSADLDRPADFITSTLRTLGMDLAIGAALIAAMLLLAFRDLRAAALCLLTIPLVLLASLAALKLFGLSLNAMTLGGLFVGLGVAIDDAVIDTESIVGCLREAETGPDSGTHSRAHAIHHALMDVRAPVVYATLLIDIALLPMLLAKGPFGALAAPLALSTIAASLASLAVSVCLTPALSLLLLRGLKPGAEPRWMRRARAAYAGWVKRICAAPLIPLVALGAAALASSLLLALLPRAPLPTFHDRHLVADLRAPTATSPQAMRRIVDRLTAAALATPGVQRAASRNGRDPTDFGAAAPDRAQIELDLDPKLNAPAQDRVAERLTRVFAGYPDVRVQVRPRLALGQATPDRAAFAVNVYGEDLASVDRAAGDIAEALRSVDGGGAITTGAGPLAPAMRIDLNFKRLALYGLSAADVLDTVRTVLEGETVAQVYDNGRAVDLVVTGPEALRRDPEAVDSLLLRSSSGVSVPLKNVANVYLTEARTSIQHEAGQRRVVVGAAPSGDPRAFAEKAQGQIRNRVRLPPGVYLTYDTPGAVSATDTRDILAAGALAALAMVGLLVLALKDGRLAVLVLLSTAFFFIGGALAAVLTGGVVSLGSLAGFVALFGLSTRGAILMVTRPHEMHARKEGLWTLSTLAAAAAHRAAPIVLTAVLVGLAVAPLLFTSAQAGGEVLGPMAVVIVGGLISGTVLSLLFLPGLIYGYSRPRDAAEA